ncbi:YjfB family protein [Metabacillus iocasae]|uniref:Motility protein n=1 Tax=Priestia iocasae TaxID=2291674 RepID=A0ABS2QQ49_9BACI|nr:YjfB family protein [Metabacillus iocasae]MBM7701438.1 hypothetical protein [Metabacillus iocasae]
MDIAALSIALNQTNIQNQSSLSMMKMTMDVSKQNGNSMIELLQSNTLPQAPHPYAGQKLDLKA